MGLLALAIAPGIAICIFIYLKDKYNREPVGLLLLSFILGMVSVIPAAIIEIALDRPL
jgi:RsiW-degrading membrane proteinase PrsW (M82 family)